MMSKTGKLSSMEDIAEYKKVIKTHVGAEQMK